MLKGFRIVHHHKEHKDERYTEEESMSESDTVKLFRRDEMEMKKYEFTGETKEVDNFGKTITLHRIRAITDFDDVKAGEVGGWIEKEANLSQEGTAWVDGNAVVRENAWVGLNAWVGEDAEIGGYALVHENARVGGKAVVGDKGEVRGNAVVRGNAEVLSTSHVLVIGPIGSRDGFITFYRDKDNEITISCGCFLGKLDQFLEKVAQTHGDSKHAQVYRAAAEMAKLQIDLSKEKRRMTLADKIRTMSDEELAQLLDEAETAGYNDSSIAPKLDNGYCMDIIDWLKSEI